MGFSARQTLALRRNLNHRQVRTREIHGRELSYIEGWYAISKANRIFGFDGWSRETIESKCVLARENRGTLLAVYITKVRITVQADGATVNAACGFPRTALSCLFLLKAYGTYPARATFSHGRRTRQPLNSRKVSYNHCLFHRFQPKPFRF